MKTGVTVYFSCCKYHVCKVLLIKMNLYFFYHFILKNDNKKKTDLLMIQHMQECFFPNTFQTDSTEN